MVAILSWTLHVNEVLLSTKFFYFLLLHFSLIYQVWFIANQKENRFLLSISLHLVHPKLAYVFETKRVSQVKYKKNALTASIVRTCYCSKSLLTCGVPNLKFDIFAINLDGLESEIDSNSCQIVFWKLVFYKPYKDSWLADPRVADYDSFVKMVKLFYHIFRINNYKFQGYSCAASSLPPSWAFLASSCSASIFSSAKNFFIKVYSCCMRFLYCFSLSFYYLLSVMAFLLVL